jgi:hypothetical protein
MGDSHPRPHDRKKAIALKAADARTLLNSALPYVVTAMTAAQLGQVQKVLDAAVVNPSVRKEYEDLMRKSVVDPALVRDYEELNRKYGTGPGNRTTGRNPSMVHRADKVLEEMIAVSEADKHVRLNFEKLLTHDALTPTTDNPDERAYLIKIRHTLFSKGVWLRFDHKLVRDPGDPSRWMIDPRTFQAWLSLDYGGDTIPTKDGRLDRNALLDTTVLGAGYYNEVAGGKVQSALDKAIRRVATEIFHGEQLHTQQDYARDDAAPGVVFVSDHLGGAHFPSKKIWDLPNQLLRQARDQNGGGNVKQSSKTIVYAAIATEVSAQVLDTYIDATVTGAQRAVKILSIAATAGKIAGTVLLITGLVGVLTRALAAEAAGTALNTVVKNRGPAAYYPTNLAGRAAFEDTINKASVTLDTEAGVGTALDRYDIAFQQRLTGWHDDFSRALKDAFAAKGRTWVTMDELDQIYQATSAKWGDPLGFLP